jgi:hypothetical protein
MTRSMLTKLSVAGEVGLTALRVRRTLRSTDVRVVVTRFGVKPRGSTPELTVDDMIWLGVATGRVLRALRLDARCLTQSLVLYAMLSRRGVKSTLVIGVRPGEVFGAHSWIEVEGHPVLPSGDQRFQELVRL